MAGFSPASNATSNLPQSHIIFYDNVFVENLKAQTPFVRCASRRDLPLNSGNQIELFMLNPLGAETVQVAEGAVLSGISVSVGTTTALIGEYSDNVSFSSLSLATAIDQTVENIGRELSYRLGQNLSAITRSVIDSASLVDASVSKQLPAGVPLGINNIRQATQGLAGRGVLPANMEPDPKDSTFCGVVHPYVIGDLLNDYQNNATVETLKFTVPGIQRMDDLVSIDLADTVEFPGTGVAFFQSNLVTLTSSYQGSAGVVAYRTYIIGKDGVIAVRLGGRGDNAIDADWRNLEVNLAQDAPLSAADPSGLIPGFSSYRVHYTASLPPDTSQRVRTIDATSAIS
jgi:hypothetical protein